MPTPPPPPPPPPPASTVQPYAVRWLPSSSAGVQGYALSLGTSTGNYDNARLTTIPVAAASPGANGSLTFMIQLDRSQDQYLAMRAYNAITYSTLSNEIRVAAMVASSAAPPSGSTAAGTTSALSASASSGSLSRAASGAGAATASALAPAEEDSGDAQTAESASLASLDMNGVDEYLATTLAAPLDLSSGFSASLWGKVPQDGAGRRGLLRLACADGASSCALELSLVRATGGTSFELRVFDAASAVDDVRETAVPVASDAWWHLALVLDSAAESARLYLDGELVMEHAGVRLPAGLTTSEHLLTLGATEAGRAAPWLGRLGHAAVFGVALGAAEVAEISLHGHEVDLRADVGSYESAGALAHYWRLGGDADAVGRDSGPAPLDFDDPYGNVDGEDVVRDGPESLAAPEESVASASQ